MRMRVLFALTVTAALAVVATAEATWPQFGGGYSTGPTYMSGTVIGGPMYAATPMYSSPGYTVVERTGPFGLMRWRTMEPTPTMIMPQPVMTATTGTTTGVMPAIATTTTPMTTPMVGQNYTFVERTGPLGIMRWRTMEPTPTIMPAPIMTTPTPTGVTTAAATTTPIPAMTGAVVASPTYTVVERSGPLGFFRWRTFEPTTTVMPAPMMTTPMPTGITPASGTTTPMAGTTSSGVITGGYVVPSTSTTTVMPATYTYRTGLFGRRYYVTPMSMDSTVMPASYSSTLYYPQYNTGRYYGFGGFGFWTR
jgi:hypothetical protein